MNNLRISILSLTIILFSLGALMLPVNTTLAHHCKGGHSGNSGCNAGDPDSGVVTYSMVFSGPLPGNSNDDTYTTSGKGIGVLTNNDDLATRIDLTFFADLFDAAGDICFGGGVGHTIDHTFKPGAVGVKEGRRGRAEATVVFKALTEFGAPAVYSLHTAGIFETNDWPPEDTDQAAIVTMTSWEMELNNHNPSDLMGACLSEGPSFDDPLTMGVEETWQIDVSLDP